MTITSYLSSYRLEFPKLTFDFGLTTQTNYDPVEGMRRFGPYDKRQYRKNPIRCIVAFPEWARNDARKMMIAFRDGMFHFRGFRHFSAGIEISEFDECPLEVSRTASPGEQADEYRKSLEEYEPALSNADLAFVLLPSSYRYPAVAPYSVSKVFFSKLGIPTQMIGVDGIRNDHRFKWSLSNIALACYAKIGNIPWVIEDSGEHNDLIIGFGKHEIRKGRFGEINRYFGFTTAFKNNGAFITFQGLSPVRTETSLGQQLQEAIVSALRQYAIQQKRITFGDHKLVPDRVILHSFKRIGAVEVEALENATRYVSERTSVKIQKLLVHIEESGSLYVFDTSDRTFLPEAGRVVRLSRRQATLLTEGRERFNKRKIGFPHPYRITLDTRSDVDADEYDSVMQDVLRQVLGLSKMNWRGFNALAIPVTLYYSRLLAEVASFCQTDDDWEAIANQERLKDKAWFI